MAQLFQVSVYEINGNPGNVPQTPKYLLISPAEINNVGPYLGNNIYHLYSQITLANGFIYGCSETVSAIRTLANA